MVKKISILSIVVIIIITGFVGSSGLAQSNQVVSNSNPTATTWYISPDGNDGNTCTSPSVPCATIQAANTKSADGDTIYVATGTYTSNGHGSAILQIEKSLVFSGGWNESFTIQSGLSTLDGELSEFCVNINTAGLVVTIDHFKMINSTGLSYGAIMNRGETLIKSSVFQNNHNSGIYNYPEGMMTLLDSTVRDNGASWAGGIFNEGSITVVRSSVTRNESYTYGGGGIRNTGPALILINSTVSNNIAQTGGGIEHSGTGNLNIYNSTIVNNRATGWGGGINTVNNAPTSMQNSILANNLANNLSPDCSGTVNSTGYNIVGDTTDCFLNAAIGDQLNTQPKVYPISTYFGLLPSSPAIDMGNTDGCLDDLDNPITDDQRKTTRPLDGDQNGTAICDIGSFEFDPEHMIVQNYLPLMGKPCPVLYFDDFSNPNTGWPVADTSQALLQYNNGEYQILNRVTNHFVAARPGFTAVDYRVSVDLRNTTGVFGSYGIVFGLTQDWSGWYTLEIYPDGWYGLYRYDVYGGAILSENYSSSIKQGSAKNHISVEREGYTIRIYANDVLLATDYDTYFYGDLYLGLINYAYNQSNVDARYDNFKVETLNCPQAGAQSGGMVEGSGAWFMTGYDTNVPVINFAKHQP